MRRDSYPCLISVIKGLVEKIYPIQEKALSSSSHTASVITEKNCEVNSSTSCTTAAADSDSGDSRYSYYS